MTSEVAVRERRGSSLPAKVEYARLLADSGLLPTAYRRQPANVLYAVEYGDMLGLAPMAAITGIHIIEGKPSASAGLISALVRRAGHKLRVTGNSQTATCEIVRSDDPDYTFSVTWTLRKNSDDNPSGEEAGLLGKQVWKNYPASMLKSRAITQCARDACEEALYGLHYTPEELGAEVGEDGEVVEAEFMDDQPAVAETDQEWLASALERAPELADKDACSLLWRDTAGKHHKGECSDEDRRQVEALITARIEELRAETEQGEAPACGGNAVAYIDGVVVPPLDPDDPWHAKVEDITCEDERADVEREVREAFAAEALDQTHANRIIAASHLRISALTAAAA